MEVSIMSQLLIELRAGEGGRDAELFCSELRSAIVAYARRRGDLIAADTNTNHHTSKTLCLTVSGPRSAYTDLAGVHRIQRIPKNGGGRRHTSTASVAVLDDQDVQTITLHDQDLKVDNYRASGNGGQHRNKTDSAVRITHVPTGLVVTSERERSQWQNLQTAKAELLRRLAHDERRRLKETVQFERNEQITSGERPAKQWTHNAQRKVVFSHETGLHLRWSDFYSGKIV
ncbi:MAG: peptide chain release factor-like protein [Acidimicrobiales bacterium]